MESVKSSQNKRPTQSRSAVCLHTLSPTPGSKFRRKRVGIGEGSGSGKTSGKGNKGQKSRSGASVPARFEGGQMPLHRRLPKRGFRSRKKLCGENVFSLVSIARLAAAADGSEMTLEKLWEKRLIPSRQARVKILGGGGIDKRIVVEAHAVSASAKEAIEKSGGEVRLCGK